MNQSNCKGWKHIGVSEDKEVEMDEEEQGETEGEEEEPVDSRNTSCALRSRAVGKAPAPKERRTGKCRGRPTASELDEAKALVTKAQAQLV